MPSFLTILILFEHNIEIMLPPISQLSVSTPYQGSYTFKNGMATKLNDCTDPEVHDLQLRRHIKAQIQQFFSKMTIPHINSADQALAALFQRIDFDKFLGVYKPLDDAFSLYPAQNYPASPIFSFDVVQSPIPGCGLCMYRYYVVKPDKTQVLFNQFITNINQQAEMRIHGCHRLFPLPAHYKQFDKSATLEPVFDHLQTLGNAPCTVWPSVTECVSSSKSSQASGFCSHHSYLMPIFYGQESAPQPFLPKISQSLTSLTSRSSDKACLSPAQSDSVKFPTTQIHQFNHFFSEMRTLDMCRFAIHSVFVGDREQFPIVLRMKLFNQHSVRFTVECHCLINMKKCEITYYPFIPSRFVQISPRNLSSKADSN